MRRSIVLWLAVLVLLLLGCRTAAPPVDVSGALPRATVVGKVTGPLGTGPVAGRLVSAVEVATGARYSTKTYVTGGFTLLVPPGRYRLEVALARAERVAEDPGILELAPGAFVRDADLVLAGAGLVSER
jgi:hypothetical protein